MKKLRLDLVILAVVSLLLVPTVFAAQNRKVKTLIQLVKNVDNKTVDNKTNIVNKHKPLKSKNSKTIVRIIKNGVVIKVYKNKYNIFRLNDMLVIDIFTPYSICSNIKVYKPQQNNLIKKIVVACHPKLKKNIYNNKYIRIAIHLHLYNYKYLTNTNKGSLTIHFVKTVKSVHKIQLEIKNQIFKKINLKGLKPIKKIKPESFKDTDNHIKETLATTVVVSQKMISRIISPYPIKNVIYSKDEQLQVQISSLNVYVKSLPIRIAQPDGYISYTYPNAPRDIYIVTNVKIYALHLVFKDIPSVVIYLPKDKNIENIQNPPVNKQYIPYTANNYVDGLIKLIKIVYNGEIPNGYIYKTLNYKNIKNDYIIQGKFELFGQYIIRVYQITALKPIHLLEQTFSSLVKKPIAVMLSGKTLNENETIFLIVVGGNNEP